MALMAAMISTNRELLCSKWTSVTLSLTGKEIAVMDVYNGRKSATKH